MVVSCTEIWQGETEEREPITTAELTPALKIKDRRREVNILCWVHTKMSDENITSTVAHYSLQYLQTHLSQDFTLMRRNHTMTLTSRTRPFPTIPMTISRPSTATSSHFSASGHGRSTNTVPLNHSLTGKQRKMCCLNLSKSFLYLNLTKVTYTVCVWMRSESREPLWVAHRR